MGFRTAMNWGELFRHRAGFHRNFFHQLTRGHFLGLQQIGIWPNRVRDFELGQAKISKEWWNGRVYSRCFWSGKQLDGRRQTGDDFPVMAIPGVPEMDSRAVYLTFCRDRSGRLPWKNGASDEIFADDVGNRLISDILIWYSYLTFLSDILSGILSGILI